MPTWSADRTEYTVSVNICGNRGYQSTVPMPVMDKLGRPASITFRLRGDEVVVVKGPEDAAPARRGRGRGRVARSGTRQS